MSVILGIDPGMATVGYCVLGGNITCGVWRTSPRDGSDAVRLDLLTAQFRGLLDATPDAAVLAIETQYLRPDRPGGVGKSVLMVARVAGAFVGIAKERGLAVVEVTPQRAKQALAGKGNAGKVDMVEAANLAYDLTLKLKDEHAADALGIALAGEAEVRFRRMGLVLPEGMKYGTPAGAKPHPADVAARAELATRTAGQVYEEKHRMPERGVKRPVMS